MSRRETRKGGRQRTPDAFSETSSASTDNPTTGTKRESGRVDIFDNEDSRQGREARSRKRHVVKVDETMYKQVLAASGIETEGMDEEERQQLAKILLLSKTEAERSSGAAPLSGDDQSPLAHDRNPPVRDRSPRARDQRACDLSPPTREQSSSARDRNNSARDWNNSAQYKVEVETKQVSKSSASDVSASSESVICLDDGLEDEPPILNDRSQRFEQRQTVACEKLPGDDFGPEDEVNKERESQCHPLNCSMSQIFSDDEDDDDTCPPVQNQQSQDLFPGSQSLPQTNDQAPQQQEMDDLSTLAEDVVDGECPTQARCDIQTEYDEETQPMEYEETECRNPTHPHRSGNNDTDQKMQEKNRPESSHQSFFARKRKAEFDADPVQKQSRLEQEESEEGEHRKACTTARWTGMDKLTGAQTMRPLKRRYRRQRRHPKEKKLYSPSPGECNQYTQVILELFDEYRTELREAQSQILNHVDWGESVKPGRHMSRTIDIKKRGRPSFYFEDLDKEEEEEEREEGCKVEDHEEEVMGVKDLKTCHTESTSQPMEPDDDFVESCIISKKLSKRHTVSPPFGEGLESGWLSSRSSTVDSGRTDPQISTRVKPLGRSLRKPQLAFAKRANTPDLEKSNLNDKKEEVMKPLRFYPNKGLRRENQKTYGKQLFKRTLHNDSPIFLDDDEAAVFTTDDDNVTVEESLSQAKEMLDTDLHAQESDIQSSDPDLRTFEKISKTADSDLETQDPNLKTQDSDLETHSPDLKMPDPDLETLVPDLDQSPPSSPMFRQTRSVNSAKKSVSKTWTFRSTSSGDVKVSAQEEITLNSDEDSKESPTFSRNSKLSSKSKRNDGTSRKKKINPDISKDSGCRNLSHASSKDSLLGDDETVDKKQQRSEHGRGICYSDTATPSTSGVNRPKRRQAGSMDECPDTLQDSSDEEDYIFRVRSRGKGPGVKIVGVTGESKAKRSSPGDENITCDTDPVDREHCTTQHSTKPTQRRLGIRGKRSLSREINESETKSGNSDRNSVLGGLGCDVGKVNQGDAQKRTSPAGDSRVQRLVVDHVASNGTDDKVCGPQTPRNRRHSALFSDHDESFNLGVQSPSRAFPAAFSSFSDENSPISKSEVRSKAKVIDGDALPLKYDPRESSRKPDQSPSSTKNMSRKPLRVTPPAIDNKTTTKAPSATGIHPNRIPLHVSVNQTVPDSILGEMSGGQRGKRKRGAVLDLDERDHSRMRVRASPQSADEGESRGAEEELGASRPSENVHVEEVAGVACPLCGVMFNQDRIETHASSCNGPPGSPVAEHGSSEGNPDNWEFAVHGHEDANNGEEETCYICDRVFPKGDEYKQHVDECLSEARRQQAQMEQGSKVRQGRAAARSTRSRHEAAPAHNYAEISDNEEQHWRA